ncbi:rhodanese-like domain-containing protein [Altererythrobacter sp.]|uniref:rhodanese-like domain-containing protein n=1 Tax=Altererythrobacter sp. TaxID=1872480 RepID=UPI003D0B6139
MAFSLRKTCAHALLGAVLLTVPAAAQQSVDLFDQDGYRSARFRAPIRIDPAPAVHIAPSVALTLDPARDALFIDVMPVEGGVRDPRTGQWRLSQDHLTIPGSQWHPETGRAPVDKHLWQGLERAISVARNRKPRLPVVIYCRADCWMSWNVARRLAKSGMKNIWWFAEGTDGWHGAGRQLIAARPVTIKGKNNH